MDRVPSGLRGEISGLRVSDLPGRPGLPKFLVRLRPSSHTTGFAEGAKTNLSKQALVWIMSLPGVTNGHTEAVSVDFGPVPVLRSHTFSWWRCTLGTVSWSNFESAPSKFVKVPLASPFDQTSRALAQSSLLLPPHCLRRLPNNTHRVRRSSPWVIAKTRSLRRSLRTRSSYSTPESAIPKIAVAPQAPSTPRHRDQVSRFQTPQILPYS